MCQNKLLNQPYLFGKTIPCVTLVTPMTHQLAAWLRRTYTATSRQTTKTPAAVLLYCTTVMYTVLLYCTTALTYYILNSTLHHCNAHCATHYCTAHSKLKYCTLHTSVLQTALSQRLQHSRRLQSRLGCVVSRPANSRLLLLLFMLFIFHANFSRNNCSYSMSPKGLLSLCLKT